MSADNRPPRLDQSAALDQPVRLDKSDGLVRLEKPDGPPRSAAPAGASPPAEAAAPAGASSAAEAPAPAVRASDADRDRVADILREALAEGRIDGTEHVERLDAAYQAKTLPELDALIRDLPAGQPRVPPPARRPADASVLTRNVVAILGGASRNGRWRVGHVINAVAVCGGVELDLTEAVFEQRELTVNVTAVCGGVDLKVPENVTLRSKGTGIMGGFDVRLQESPDPGAPVITVQGVALCGGVDAKPVQGRRITDLSGPDS